MKKTFLLFCLCFVGSLAKAQTFGGPESVEYDAQNARWLVANTDLGNIVEYNPAANSTTVFCSGLTTGPYGIEIMGNRLYACDGSIVRGYNLNTGSQEFAISITNAMFLNGITSDGNDFLYVTDFSAKKIYRVHPADTSFTVLASTSRTPNGILYDGANQRCVFVTWGSSAIVQAVSTSTGTVTNLASTTLSNCDGITRDTEGNWYVTAWGNNSLHKFDSAFSAAPTVAMSGLSSPADIDISADGDSIGISNSGAANNVVFHTITVQTGVQHITPQEKLWQVFLSPNTQTFSVLAADDLVGNTWQMVSTNGQILQTGQLHSAYTRFDSPTLPAGIFIFRLQTNNGSWLHQKISILR